MARWLFAAALACGGLVANMAPAFAQTPSAPANAPTKATSTEAAPTTAAPTEARVDALLDAMDMRRTLDEMLAQIDAMGETMGQQMLGESATPEQRDALKRVVAQQRDAMRGAMSWETMAPIYKRVYMRLFTADEVEAMIAFYGSDAGRGIMRKMPQAMQITMEEMAPVMQRIIGDLRSTLEQEIERQAETEASSAR